MRSEDGLVDESIWKIFLQFPPPRAGSIRGIKPPCHAAGRQRGPGQLIMGLVVVAPALAPGTSRRRIDYLIPDGFLHVAVAARDVRLVGVPVGWELALGGRGSIRRVEIGFP